MTGSQPGKTKVAAFMRKIEYKMFSKEGWHSMTKEQQMQVRKQCVQQGIKLAAKQTSTEALETQLRISSQPEEGDVKHKEGEAPKEPA